ncbi:MAG: hypothetical protein L6V93_07975 [Clostridiales bacterium]|nr:MAG: hypothetical protein L6V93_07975 [Clostridiales bacterium]
MSLSRVNLMEQTLTLDSDKFLNSIDDEVEKPSINMSRTLK